MRVRWVVRVVMVLLVLMVAFGLRYNIHRSQGFGAGQETLIQAPEYVALQKQKQKKKKGLKT